ncbi:uncharacterized protein LOC116767314 [Danaus plexippus]|uniref:uncharacterized protein LOC116767314 n=1 Tax=Danaus plexippus TaxID=13037 RepID=UPI000239E1B9|nr:uncharacterized protein LOC116767314 [Danaus plexippus]
MLSKLFRPINSRVGLLLAPKIRANCPPIRRFFELIPPTQYDMPMPKKLQFIHVMKNYWEVIPLFLVTAASLVMMVLSIAWAVKNKVDVVYSSRSRDNISRTMDLRNPSVHKILTINQRYEPWPEMQDSLDKMVMAEKRALVRLQSCSHA